MQKAGRGASAGEGGPHPAQSQQLSLQGHSANPNGSSCFSWFVGAGAASGRAGKIITEEAREGGEAGERLMKLLTH